MGGLHPQEFVSCLPFLHCFSSPNPRLHSSSISIQSVKAFSCLLPSPTHHPRNLQPLTSCDPTSPQTTLWVFDHNNSAKSRHPSVGGVSMNHNVFFSSFNKRMLDRGFENQEAPNLLGDKHHPCRGNLRIVRFAKLIWIYHIRLGLHHTFQLPNSPVRHCASFQYGRPLQLSGQG